MPPYKKEHTQKVSRCVQHIIVTFSLSLLSEVPSGAPMNLTVVALNSSTTQVSWDPPLSETQNGPISGYVVQIIGINTDEDFEIQSYEGPNTFTVSNLHPFYAYAYTIAAIGTGIGPYSTALVFQMPEEGKQSFQTMDVYR